MYYKVEKSKPLFDELMKVKEEIKIADTAMHNLACELSDLDNPRILRGRHSLSGRIEGIQFKESLPSWLPVRKWTGFYMPRASGKFKKINRFIFESFDELPRVPYSRLNDLINFREGFYGTVHIRSPGVSWSDDCILIEMSDKVVSTYVPHKDMTEILASEYYKQVPTS